MSKSAKLAVTQLVLVAICAGAAALAVFGRSFWQQTNAQPADRPTAHEPAPWPAGLPDSPGVLWKFEGPRAGSDATPLIVDGVVYIGGSSTAISARIDLATGDKRWEAAFPDGGFNASAAVSRRAASTSAMPTASSIASTPPTARRSGSYKTEGRNQLRRQFLPRLGAVRLAGRHALCLDADTGKLVWKHEIDDQIRCSPTVVEDRAFIAGCDGKLHMIALDDGTEVGERRYRIAHRHHAGGAGDRSLLWHRSGHVLRDRLARAEGSLALGRTKGLRCDSLECRGHARGGDRRQPRQARARTESGRRQGDLDVSDPVAASIRRRWWSVRGCSSARPTAACMASIAARARRCGNTKPAANSPASPPWPTADW